MTARAPSYTRTWFWLEYADRLGYLDGTDPYVRVGISEEGEEMSERDPISLRMRTVISPFRPKLWICFYRRRVEFEPDSLRAWELFAKHRIVRYWCEVEGKKVFRAKSLKVLTGEALPGIWNPTDDPFTDQDREQQFYGMVIRKDVA